MNTNDTQDKVYEFIGEHWNENLEPPSVRDICAVVPVSTATVHYHIHRLEGAGRIALTPKGRPIPPHILLALEKATGKR